MKSLLTLSVLLLSAPVVFAQQITNVTVNPNPLLACVQAEFRVIGTAPNGMQFTYVNTSVTSNSITLVIEASGPASGSGSFNNPVTGGPYAEGTYALSVSLEYNGTITSTWTGTLNVLAPNLPNVGEPNAITICPNDASFSLTSRLNGTPDPGGIWLTPQLQVVPNGIFVPGTNLAGDYLYYFDVNPPCESEYQYLSIQYNPNTTAGTSTSVTLCTAVGAPPVDLFSELGGNPDAGGTWSGAGTTGTFTPGVSATGQYVYQVTGIPPCANSTATVTVLPGTPSNAGVGDSAIFCFDETEANLSNYVTGKNTTGIWYGPDGSGITFHNQPIDVSAYGEGVYTYIVTTSPCPSDTAFVTVTLDGPPCTLGIKELEPNGAKLMVMPNPASDHVTVEVERRKVTGEQSIVIMDVNGKVVLRKSLNSSGNSTKQTVDISTLVPGAYMIDLVGCGRTTAQRLMVR
ncbi:MAG: T9SS type A sorting domain-containing protein [Flavobacteriales bacterium]